MVVNTITLFLNRPKNILRAFGVWLPPEKYVGLHKLYMLIVMLTQYNFVLFEFIYIANVWGDLDEVSEASYLLFTQASLCFKATVFLVYKGNLVDLLDLMESDTFLPQSEEHERLLIRRARTIKRLCMFFLTSAITTCSLWAMIPLFDNVGNRSFPFKIWMPVGPEKSPQYELGYIYQMVSIYISAFLFIGVDSVALSMIMFGCAQLEIIIDKVQQIRMVPISLNMESEERQKRINDNNKLLKECIQHYQGVVRFVEIVENTYHANIFFQLSGTVAIICIIGLRISIVEPNSVQFCSMLNYMVTMLSQLFLYCWCGNELTIRVLTKLIKHGARYYGEHIKTENGAYTIEICRENRSNLLVLIPGFYEQRSTPGILDKDQDLRDHLYQSPWYEQDHSFKRLLRFTLLRLQKPIIFKAGHYIPLSRPSFVAVLRSSYSYFAVLNQANSK